MRINHNISALNTNRQLAANNLNASKSMEKLSSGLRINRAADDAAGLAVSEKMRAQIRGLNQATRNAQDGISFIQTAEGALNEVSDMLGRMKELLVQRANGTYDTTDQTQIDAELKALNAAIGSIKSNTKFNGKDVFAIASFAVSDDGASVTVATEAAAFASFTDETAIGTAGAGKINMTNVDAMIGTVNSDRAKLGAKQNQLEHIVNNLSTTTENLTAAESRIRDVDMASEMMNYTKNSILLQAAQAMLAQANSQPQGVLQLLR